MKNRRTQFASLEVYFLTTQERKKLLTPNEMRTCFDCSKLPSYARPCAGLAKNGCYYA